MLKYLKSKVFHYEKAVEKLEKERSELSTRVVMGQEQLKATEQHNI